VNGGNITASKVQVAGYEGTGIWVLDSTGLLSLSSYANWSSGSELTWSVGASFDADVAYANNMIVTFAGELGDVTATVEGAISATELNVEAGTNLILAGTGTVTASNTLLEGDLTVKTTGNSLGTITVGEAGSLIIATGGETTLADSIGLSRADNLAFSVADGTALSVTTSGSLAGNVTIHGTLNLGAGDVVNYGVSNDQLITIDGGTLELGEFRQSFAARNKLVPNNATVNGTGDQHGGLDFFQNGCSITSSGESTINAPIRLRNSNETTTVNVIDGTLTVNAFCNSPM
jgi:hypothetical protein